MNDKIKRGCAGCGCVGVLAVVGTVVVYPMLKQKQEQKKTAGSCFSNLKEIGLGLAQYAQDYDEHLPPAAGKTAAFTWRTEMVSYVQRDSVFTCPDRATPAQTGPDGYPASYAVNTAGSAHQGENRGPFAPLTTTFDVTKAAYPAQTIAVCEIQNGMEPGFDIDDTAFGPPKQILFAGHDGQSNYLFLDGHVKAFAPEDTGAGGKSNLWYRDGSALSSNGQAVLAATAR